MTCPQILARRMLACIREPHRREGVGDGSGPEIKCQVRVEEQWNWEDDSEKVAPLQTNNIESVSDHVCVRLCMCVVCS